MFKYLIFTGISLFFTLAIKENTWALEFKSFNPPSLDEYNSYSGIGEKTKNVKKQKDILASAFENEENWARFCVAADSVESNPKIALEIYSKFAIEDNCYAQARLAQAYFTGKYFTPKDIKKAYFWYLLATSGALDRSVWYVKSCGFYVGVDSHRCSSFRYKVLPYESDIEKKLKPKEIEAIQNLASNWKKGDTVDDILVATTPAKKGTDASTKTIDDGKALPQIKLESYSSKEIAKDKKDRIGWSAIAQVFFKERLNTNLDTTKIFETSVSSVWTVLAANSKKDLSLGSAVAVTGNTLLTNCHVVLEHKSIVIMRGEEMIEAKIISADEKNDKCILSITKSILDPVKGFRKYSDLKVGEDVFSIGSPKGLEATLGQGIISGLRTNKGIRLIQISAPISKGSSGGGIFDKFGNLIGISTFQITDSQNMNFSIPVEDFYQE